MPTQEDVDEVFTWETFWQHVRGIGWALLTIAALFALCIAPAWLLYLGVRWLLAHVRDLPPASFLDGARDVWFYFSKGVIDHERFGGGF